MAERAPGHVPSSPSPHYSTLEAVNFNNPQHSTLEPVYPARDDTLEYKEVYASGVPASRDAEAGALSGGFMRRRLCGLSMKIALILAAVLLAAITGAVVGGVLGSQKGNHASTDPVATATSETSPNPSSSTTPTSPDTATSAAADLRPEVPHNVFSQLWWYKITTSGNALADLNPETLSLQAYYLEGTEPSSPKVGTSLNTTSSNHVSEQWHFHEVPGDWENGTHRWPSNYTSGAGSSSNATRTFWIVSRKYGPDVRLTVVDEPTTNGYVPPYPYVQMRPKDLSDLGQYWLSTVHRCETATGAESCWKFYNMKSGGDSKMWADDPAGWRKPVVGPDWRGREEHAWDAWLVLFSDEIIYPDDSGFTWGADSEAQ